MKEAPSRKMFEEALQRRALKELAYQLRDAGWSQVAIYVFFSSFAQQLSTENRQEDLEKVEDDALDYIWGWCATNKMWFEEGLTQDQVSAYLSAHKDEKKLRELP